MVEHKLPKLVTRVRFPSPAPIGYNGTMKKITNNDMWPQGFRGLFFLVIILGLFFSYEMGNRPFASPDEGRYVEIPREMVVSGDYITPRLNDLKYFEKPPLFYWMQAAVIKVEGINEDSMRFWIILFSILGCLMVYTVGKKCYSSVVGILSAGTLATSLIYYAHSRIIILDLVFSILISGCLWSFFLAFIKKNEWQQKHRKKLLVAMYAFSALACLTKGLAGAVLPGMVCFIWITATNNWKLLREILYVPGILLFFAIFLPWHVLVAYRNDDFLHFYFVVEHFLRYTTSIHNRYKPMWFFIPIVLAGMMPWTGFSLISLKNLFRNIKNRDSESIFFASWIIGIFVFFSLSNSKLIPYILPIVPPLALITAIFFANANYRDFKIGALINFSLVLISTAALVLTNPVEDVLKNPDAKFLLYIIIGFLYGISFIQMLAGWKKITNIMGIIISIFLSGNMLWTVNKISTYYVDIRKPSTRKVVQAIRMNKTKDDLVFCYNVYYQDFPVYLNDTVGVINFVGELDFGAKSEPSRSKLIREEEFWKLWNTTNKRIFLLLSRDSYRDVFVNRTNIHRILEFDKNFIAITNK